MECFIGIKNKEIYEKYYEKLGDWHLNIFDECDVYKLKKLLISCRNTIIITNESDFKPLLDSIKDGHVKRTELELFLFKLDYYLAKIRCIKLELGCHIVTFNEGYKNINTLRTDFSQIYKHIRSKKEIKGFYTLIHKKYRYILKGSTSDFMNIKTIKQAKYIKVYIELLWLTEEVNKLWKLNTGHFKLESYCFSQENILHKLEEISEDLHKISNLFIIYNRFILKLLKKNTSYKQLNPYDQSTYDKVNDVVNYIYYYNECITGKNYLEDFNVIEKIVYKVI